MDNSGTETDSSHVKLISQGIVCSMPDAPFGYFAWPSLVRQENGTLCLVASGFRKSHVCPWGRTVITKSQDNGQTWSPMKIVNNSPIDDRDAGIVDLGHGRLALTWFSENTMNILNRRRLPDGTWPEAYKDHVAICSKWSHELIEKELGSWTRVSEDGEYWGEQRRAPVTSPHGFCLLKDGSWLYLGKDFSTLGEGTDLHPDQNSEIIAVRSMDEGRTWQKLGTVPRPDYIPANSCYEPHVIELGSGELLGAVRVEGRYQEIDGVKSSIRGLAPKGEVDFRTMMTRSSDGGKTWSIMEETCSRGTPPHLLLHSSGAIICSYGYRRKPFGQRCMISYDNGRTWKCHIIRDDGFNMDLGYPSSAELPDGSILTIYYQIEKPNANCSILWSRWELPDKG